MQPLRLSNLVVLAALVCTGAAIRCYVGFEGTDNSTECPGSCSRSSVTKDGRKVIALACHPMREEERCSQMTIGGVRIEACLCNSDYCNTSPTTSPTTATPIASPTTPDAAIRCFEGPAGTRETTDCQGTCFTATDHDTGNTALGCQRMQMEVPEVCVDMELEGKQAKVCYCNSNYCNAKSRSSSSTSLPSRPSSASTSLPSLLLLIPLLFSFMLHVF